MTLYVDTSNIQEICKWTREYNIAKGITTNPKIFLKDSQKDKQTNIKKAIHNILKISGDLPVNIELTKTSGSDEDLVKEGEMYADFSKKIVIKIPMWSDGRGLRIAKKLKDVGIPVNLTCCMSIEQVILTSMANIEYVSLFFNRMVDHYVDHGFRRSAFDLACKTIQTSKDYLSRGGSITKIIVGSIRNPTDVTAGLINGADIVTVPPDMLAKMFHHPKTDETIAEFDKAWRELNKTS